MYLSTLSIHEFLSILNLCKVSSSSPSYSCDSLNMGTSDLPDMHAQSPRATATARADGIHMRQITCAHVTTNM